MKSNRFVSRFGTDPHQAKQRVRLLLLLLALVLTVLTVVIAVSLQPSDSSPDASAAFSLPEGTSAVSAVPEDFLDAGMVLPLPPTEKLFAYSANGTSRTLYYDGMDAKAVDAYLRAAKDAGVSYSKASPYLASVSGYTVTVASDPESGSLSLTLTPDPQAK